MKKFFYFLIVLTFIIPSALIAQEKPLLSEAIKKAIDTKGIEGAKRYFNDLYETQKENYDVDMNGISKLSNDYIQNGNNKAAGAVMEIAAPFMSRKISSYVNKESKDIKVEKEQKEKKTEIKEKRKVDKVTDYQGDARDDLERFTGLYGDPAEKNKTRRLWVRVSCDGYLVSGALWGDVAPWWMKSESDNVFSYSDSFNHIKMEFVTDSKGKAVKMIHNIPNLKTPLERLEPIPDNWGPCVERREG